MYNSALGFWESTRPKNNYGKPNKKGLYNANPWNIPKWLQEEIDKEKAIKESKRSGINPLIVGVSPQG